jgi:hypothetical protein
MTGNISIQEAIRVALAKKRQDFNSTGVFSAESDKETLIRY